MFNGHWSELNGKCFVDTDLHLEDCGLLSGHWSVDNGPWSVLGEHCLVDTDLCLVGSLVETGLCLVDTDLCLGDTCLY